MKAKMKPVAKSASMTTSRGSTPSLANASMFGDFAILVTNRLLTARKIAGNLSARVWFDADVFCNN